MKRLLTNAAMASGVWLCLLGAAYGQLKDNIEVNAFGGGSFFNSKDFEISSPQSVTPINSIFRFNSTWQGGLRLGVYTRGHWSQEFFYSYQPNTAHFIRQTAPTGSINLGLAIHNYGITALYYLNDNESRSFRPFLSVGVGGTYYHFTPEATAFANDPLRGNVPDINNDNELALNYGVGVKTRGSKWLGFRADVRDILGRTPSFGLARQSTNPNATVFPVSGGLHNAEATAGVIFYFFGKR
jgi:outer membrane protein W